MQKIVILMERKRTDKRHKISTQIGSSLQNVIHRRSSEYFEEGGGFVQPIWTVCMDEMVRFVASAGIEGERSESMKTLLNVFSKPGVEKLADLVGARLQA